MRWIGIGALLLVLTACGGDDEAPQPGELPYIPELRNPEPVAKDMTMDPCGLEAGSQTAAGAVTNSADDPMDFLITVNWVDDALELRGQGVAVINDLPPGATQDWTANGQLLEGATQCIPSVFRGELAE